MRRLAAVLLLVLLLAGALLALGMRASTPPIESSDGKSIASLEWVELGGYRQAALIRGASTDNPVLLFLHGGPGMPLMYLAHPFQRPLEDDFIVVQSTWSTTSSTHRSPRTSTATPSRPSSSPGGTTGRLRSR